MCGPIYEQLLASTKKFQPLKIDQTLNLSSVHHASIHSLQTACIQFYFKEVTSHTSMNEMEASNIQISCVHSSKLIFSTESDFGKL